MRLKVLAASLGAAAALLLLNWLFFRQVELVYESLPVIAVLLAVLPPVLEHYRAYKSVKELEDKFPSFLSDFVETVRGGMGIPEAFKSVARNDYGKLSVHVRRIAAQLGWGVPVEEALLRFAKSTRSALIQRVVSSVIEGHRHGGPLADTFEALSKVALEIEKLKSERRTYLYGQLFTGYVIFFVFLGVMIGLYTYLIPSLVEAPRIEAPGVARQAQKPEQVLAAYKELFRHLILIQGLFAGLAVGKMAEGVAVAGIKHSLFMMLAGFSLFTLLT